MKAIVSTIIELSSIILLLPFYPLLAYQFKKKRTLWLRFGKIHIFQAFGCLPCINVYCYW